MRKLLMIITFLLLSPFVVNAEECTTEQISAYNSFASQVVVSPKRLGDSDTYEVWASNVKGGIALENGRTVFDEGFLGYAQAGESYNVRIYIADGSICAGQTVKNLKINIPTVTAPPKEDPIPPTNDSNNNANDNEIQKPPVVNQKPTENIQKPSVDDSTTSNENPNDNKDISDDIKEENNSQIEKDANQFETGTDQIENKETKSNKTNYMALIISILSFLALIVLLIIYMLKRKKTASK